MTTTLGGVGIESKKRLTMALAAGALVAAMLPGAVSAVPTPPTVDACSASPETLWPPNHQLVAVTATVSATDHEGNPLTPSLVSVTSNEADNDIGDGNTPNGIVIVDDYTFQLRAERAAAGDGREYVISYMVTDYGGNTATCSVEVFVPHLDWGSQDVSGENIQGVIFPSAMPPVPQPYSAE